jgi:hypothetical protein
VRPALLKQPGRWPNLAKGLTMRTIQLSGGGCAIVDDVDYDNIAKFSWRNDKDRDGRLCYATRSVRIDGLDRKLRMHRVITKAPSAMLVDHINGNGLDNRRANLRIVTHSQNQQNTTSSKNQKRGGYKGVHWDASKNSWQARIRIPSENGGRGRKVHLGSFKDPVSAALAYDAASILYHPCGSLNFPNIRRG